MSAHRQGREPGPRGCTLIEILVLMTIIGILNGIVGCAALHQLRRARVRETRLELAQAKSALLFWQERTGLGCPASLDILVKDGLLSHPPRDAWRRLLILTCMGGEAVSLRSRGADGRVGTDDDLVDRLVPEPPLGAPAPPASPGPVKPPRSASPIRALALLLLLGAGIRLLRPPLASSGPGCPV